MSVVPLTSWVNRTRKVMLWVGFGWPPMVILLTGLLAKRGGVDWAIVGILFLTAIFLPLSLVLSLLLPTYKSRIIAVPPVLLALFWIVSSGFRIPPYMLLWITTFTAIGLVIPQHSTMELFFRRLFARRA
jgi:hypothetical protein